MRPGFMLAERAGPQTLDQLARRGYLFELKVDGIRALAEIDAPAGQVALWSRNGLSLARRYPDLVDALRTLDGFVGVLDAEISVAGPDGLPSWAMTLQRTQQAVPSTRLLREAPAHLYVFDVLSLDGADQTSQPFATRRALLEQLAEGFPPSIGLTPLSDDPHALWTFVTEHRLEGVVAKKATSPYRAGRSPLWVKLKAVQSVSCLVGGVDYAPDLPDEPRSLHLFLVDDDGELLAVGKASAGVAPAMRKQIKAGLRKPPLIVDVEYGEVTATTTLRHPVIRRIRTDLDVLDCSVAQLR